MGLDDDVGIGWFPVYFSGKCAVLVACYVEVQEGDTAINFVLSSEFDSLSFSLFPSLSLLSLHSLSIPSPLGFFCLLVSFSSFPHHSMNYDLAKRVEIFDFLS